MSQKKDQTSESAMLPPFRVHGRGGFDRAMRLPAPPWRSVIKTAGVAAILLIGVIVSGYAAISVSIAPSTSLYVHIAGNQRETNLVAGLTEEPVTASQLDDPAPANQQQTAQDLDAPVPHASDVPNLQRDTASAVPLEQAQLKSGGEGANTFVRTGDQAEDLDKTVSTPYDSMVQQNRAVADGDRGDDVGGSEQQDAREAAKPASEPADITDVDLGARDASPGVPSDGDNGENRVAALRQPEPEPDHKSMVLEPATDPAAPVEIVEKEAPDLEAAKETEASSRCDRDALRAMVERTVIRFQVGSSEVPDRFLGDLRKLGQLVEDCPDVRIEIAGHSDPIGSEGLNFELSWERAEAVATALADLGFQASPFITVGYGARQPLKSISLPPVELEQVADASQQTLDPESLEQRRRELEDLRRRELVRLHAVNRRVQFKIR